MNLFNRAVDRGKQIGLSFLAKKKAESNLNRELDKRFASDPMANMGQVSDPRLFPRNKEEQQYLLNKQIGVVGGFMQPSKFINTAHTATSAPGLNTRIGAMDAIKREAQEQLTPEELMKHRKNLFSDNVIQKIHKRLMNQEAGMTVDNMRNLLRRK
jgi:hypothetical protein